MITDSWAQALSIVKDHPGCSAKVFSHFMWPAEKVSAMSAGGLLGKLVKAGYLKREIEDGHRYGGGYSISSAGEEALKDYGMVL